MTDLRECVLIVDDEFLIADCLRAQIECIGMKVCGIAATAEAAVALAEEHRPRVVLMDVRLRGKTDGVDAALAIHESVGSRVIFVTGSKEPRTVARIQLDHPTAVLFKPFSDRQLRSVVEGAMQR